MDKETPKLDTSEYKLFKFVMNNSQDIIYIYDIIEKRNIYSNEGILNLLGYTAKEVKEMGEKLIPILMHPSDFEVYLSTILPKYQKAKDNEWIEHDYRMKHKNGEWRWIHSKETIFKRTNKAAPRQIFGILSDISEEKHAKYELQVALQKVEENEQKYLNLFSSMQEGVYLHEMIYDEQGNAINYRITDANPISEKYLNIKRENAIGKTATNLFGTSEAPFINIYAKVAETGEPYAFEQYFEPMNKHFYISVFSPKKGEFATVFLDITKTKNYEQELIVAKEKAEESDRLKSSFLANMSHEIRTPMNAILGFSSLLRKENLSKDKKEKYLELVDSGGKRLLNIISDIVDISKIDANQLTLNYEVFNLNMLIDDLQNQFEMQTEYQQCEIKTFKG